MNTKADKLWLDTLIPGVLMDGPLRGTPLYSNEEELIAFLSLKADVYETLPARTLNLGDLLKGSQISRMDSFSIYENGEQVGRLLVFDKAITPDKAFACAIKESLDLLRAKGVRTEFVE